ncbi:ABC transporter permease [Gordonia sp. NPDC003585]|uniref:ABC transporter permease n=1 Tax=unclassified Gordonia (in: high G+C Gram-positive bacteria) TaxID=2657482 RepID=UPI0033BE3CC3
MIATIDSERIKLMSTRSPYWCVAIVAVLGLGLAALISSGGPVDELTDNPANVYLLGVNQFGLAVLLIMAVLGITTEYRFGTIRLSFEATPRRWQVLVAKGVVFAIVGLVVTFVICLLGLVIAKLFAGDDFDLTSSDAIRQLWGTPIFIALAMLIGVAVGALIRQTAGAVTIVLVWTLLVETVVIPLLPKVGEPVVPFLPFTNGWRFLTGDTGDFHWNIYGSLVYFALVALVILGAAIAVVNKRDA